MTWWQIVVSVLTVSVSYLAARRGTRGNREATKQRERQAERDDWFKRYSWAIGEVASSNPLRVAVGMNMLKDLVDTSTSAADKRAVRTASALVLAQLREVRDSGVLEPPEISGAEGAE